MHGIGNKQTVAFFGTVAAGSNKTLVSQKITQSFKTIRFHASFAPGIQRLMTLKFFISTDKSTPTTAEPQGVNVLQQLGQVAYITGDDEWKDLEHEIIHSERNAYLKVYAENADVVAHTIDAQITIEYIPMEDITER